MIFYQLVGFISPKCSGASFIFPCFSSQETNALFVQELDVKRTIAYFQEADITNYKFHPYTGSYVVKKVGDFGIYACIVKDIVYVGKRDEISSQIQCLLPELEQSPFFRQEFGRFSGSKEILKVARNDCLDKIEDNNIKRIYNSLIAVRGKIRPREPASYVLDFLRSGFDNPEWLSVWRKAWMSSSDRDGLMQLAIWYFEQNANDTLNNISSLVLRSLLTYSPTSSDLGRLIVTRLSRVNADESWSRLWLRYANKSRRKDRTVIALGMEFLKIVDEPNALGLATAWAEVWLRLWNLGANRFDLGLLADEPLRQFPLENKFVSSVVLPVAKSDLDQQNVALSALEYWVRERKAASNLWAQAFKVVLDNVPSAETVELGIVWLRRFVEISKWVDVWLSIKSFIPPKDFKELGELWLGLSIPTMHVRPVVIAELLSGSGLYDKRLLAVANDWLSSLDVEKGSKSVRRTKVFYKDRIEQLLEIIASS